MSLLARLLGRRREPVPLTLYTRADCALCEEMKAEIAKAGLSRPYELTEVDVDSDRKLKKAFGASVPVLAIAGRVAFEGRLDAALLRAAFDLRAAEWERARTLAKALGQSSKSEA